MTADRLVPLSTITAPSTIEIASGDAHAWLVALTRPATAEARVETDHASRYLTHLCEHAYAMGAGTEWSETHGTIHFGASGRCVLDASETTLTVRVEAATSDDLRRIQDIIGSDFGRFGRREELRVSFVAV